MSTTKDDDMIDEQERPDFLDDPYFKHGMEIGSDLGFSNATEEAQTAYDAGEIELWLDFNRPKSMEDWDKWEAEHGPNEKFAERWKRK